MKICLVPPVLLAVGLLTTGCGEKPGPAAPTPTVTDLKVNGADALFTGVSSVYTAIATRSDGSVRVVAAGWSSGDASVATLDASGRFVGSRHGLVTVSATFQGMTATKTVRVVNRYGGSWEGTFVVRHCMSSGASAQSGCARTGVGSVHKVDLLILEQDGDDLSHVTGQLANWSVDFDGQIIIHRVTGQVTRDGGLILTADCCEGAFASGWRWSVPRWETQLTGTTEMRGQWIQDETGPTGARHWEYELVTMTNPYPGGR